MQYRLSAEESVGQWINFIDIDDDADEENYSRRSQIQVHKQGGKKIHCYSKVVYITTVLRHSRNRVMSATLGANGGRGVVNADELV
jgi:hypothetical protein